MAVDKKFSWRVLVVDDEENNLQLMRQILRGTYKLSLASDGIQALKLAKQVKPDLILLDIMMPQLDGYAILRKLKSNPDTAKIPVIFVTARAEEEDERRGFEVGAVDYITKPVSPPIVHARVATHLALYDQQKAFENQIRQRTDELAKSQEAAIHMLGEAGHYNDTDTGVHIWRMAAYSGAIARGAGWHVLKARQLELAAPMHDTGKIGIPDAILKKPGKLDSEEWQRMKTHSQIGYEILAKSSTPLFQIASEVALYHHERWDGGGYPKGFAGAEIPESARIVAISDVFDALTMQRPYKQPWPVADAMEEIRVGRLQHFDPDLVDVFFNVKGEILELKAKWDAME